LVLTLPERGIEPLQRKAALGADRCWHVKDVALPFAGRWHVRIKAETAFQKITRGKMILTCRHHKPAIRLEALPLSAAYRSIKCQEIR
jgi:hypothetical protein